MAVEPQPGQHRSKGFRVVPPGTRRTRGLARLGVKEGIRRGAEEVRRRRGAEEVRRRRELSLPLWWGEVPRAGQEDVAAADLSDAQ